MNHETPSINATQYRYIPVSSLVSSFFSHSVFATVIRFHIIDPLRLRCPFSLCPSLMSRHWIAVIKEAHTGIHIYVLCTIYIRYIMQDDSALFYLSFFENPTLRKEARNRSHRPANNITYFSHSNEHGCIYSSDFIFIFAPVEGSGGTFSFYILC